MMGSSDIRQRFGTEMGLVVLICRVFLKTAAASELPGYISANKIDWLLLEKIITAHHVRPVVFKILSTAGSGADATFLDRLRLTCMRLSASNLLQLEELKKINSAFLAAGIRYLPFKGIILSQALFDDVAARETVDIDLLLDAMSFSKAREVMLVLGYTSQYYDPAFEKQFLRTSHELQFTKTAPAATLKVELHWNITSRMMAVRLNNNELFQHARQSNLSRLTVNAPDPTATLLMLLVHHGVNDVWRSLKHTMDIAAFMDRYSAAIDWEDFHRIAVRSKIRHTAETGFAIAHELFGVEIPTSFRRTRPSPSYIMDDLLRLPALTKGKLQKENLSRQLFLRDSFSDKMGLLLSYLRVAVVPNIRDIERFPLPKRLYFLYYLIKPFRMLRRKRKLAEKK